MTSFLLLVSKLGHQVNSFKAQVEARGPAKRIYLILLDILAWSAQDIFNISDNLAEHFEFLDQQPKVFPGLPNSACTCVHTRACDAWVRMMALGSTLDGCCRHEHPPADSYTSQAPTMGQLKDMLFSRM